MKQNIMRGGPDCEVCLDFFLLDFCWIAVKVFCFPSDAFIDLPLSPFFLSCFPVNQRGNSYSLIHYSNLRSRFYNNDCALLRDPDRIGSSFSRTCVAKCFFLMNAMHFSLYISTQQIMKRQCLTPAPWTAVTVLCLGCCVTWPLLLNIGKHCENAKLKVFKTVV